MYYFERDVWFLINQGPYIKLASESSGMPLLRRARRLTEDYDKALLGYPAVRCEPLDFLYVCLANLGALNRDLFRDFVFECNWRGIVWGAWLAALSPCTEYCTDLRKARPVAPKNQWIVDVALASFESGAPISEAVACVQHIREALARLPKPKVSLRRAPDQTELVRLAQERSAMLGHYRAGGAASVLAHLPGTLLSNFLPDYPSWHRRNIAFPEERGSVG